MFETRTQKVGIDNHSLKLHMIKLCVPKNASKNCITSGTRRLGGKLDMMLGPKRAAKRQRRPGSVFDPDWSMFPTRSVQSFQKLLFQRGDSPPPPHPHHHSHHYVQSEPVGCK